MRDASSSNSTSPDTAPVFLTTREVADLLRVKERKVYDLAAEGDIPHRRITGKLLFPRDALMAWISGTAETPRPDLATGSHDPLLDWAIGASGAEMATLWNGSRAGLDAFLAGDAALAALHLPEPDGWNIAEVSALAPREAVLLHWAQRARGVLIAPQLVAEIGSFEDLAGRRVVPRQPGAGAALLMARFCADRGVAQDSFAAGVLTARTEAEAAGMVARGEADAALGIAAMARSYSLGFLPLVDESVDLLICRRQAFAPPLQKLLTFVRTAEFRDRAEALGGYDVSEAGTVRWLGP